MLTCHKPFCKETLLCWGIENKTGCWSLFLTTSSGSGPGKDPRVTGSEREIGAGVASVWVILSLTSLTSHRGCFDQRVIPGSAGLYCPVRIIMDTATCPGPLKRVRVRVRGPNWLLMRIKCASKEVRRAEQRVINRNCFIVFWRLTLNGRSLFLCLDNCQKSDGVLITLVLLYAKCSENRFTRPAPSPGRMNKHQYSFCQDFHRSGPIQPIYLGSWTFTQISNMARTVMCK